jgi:hypothetical protein
MRTPEQYKTAIDDACQAAADSGPMWNQLFVKALAERGLALVPPPDSSLFLAGMFASDDYPESLPMDAPLHFTEGPVAWKWPHGSLVVWADHAAARMKWIYEAIPLP